jgi:allophanate hydrolase subunit 1
MSKLYVKNSDEETYKNNKYDLAGIKRSKKLLKLLKKIRENKNCIEIKLGKKLANDLVYLAERKKVKSEEFIKKLIQKEILAFKKTGS